jgi:TM2 domain-containing membrane protein YozV
MYRVIGIDGKTYGPVSADQLRRWIAEQRVNLQSMVLAEGATEWRPLSALQEFATEAKPPPLTANVPPAMAPLPASDATRASSKIPAGVCGILLGALGIHKFILGYTGAGLIMLLVTILTCFLAYPVMHLIGMIEGIIYLTKSDQEFVRTYVDKRREWF